jgi:hypothetical protein
VIPTAHYDPPAAFMGTRFDETRACPECGSGRIQIDQLVIPEKVGRKAVVARSLGQEWIVARAVAQAATVERLRGVEFDDVYVIGGDGTPSQRWVQPLLTSTPVEVIPPTVAANDILDPRNEFRCSTGDPTHNQAREVVSEVTVRAGSWDGSDVVRSVGLYGGLAGYLRPGPLVFVSQRGRAALQAAGTKGYRLEVCHLDH